MIDVVIPAWNEEKTIGPILETITTWSKINRTIVVIDSKTTDDTELIAREIIHHCGWVIDSPGLDGKGQCVMAGVDAVATERVMFLDADLTGLTHEHLDRLIRVDHGMTIGVPDYPTPEETAGAKQGHAKVVQSWHWVSGERVVPIRLITGMEFPLHGYMMETQINRAAGIMGPRDIRLTRLRGLKSPFVMSERRLADMERDMKWGVEHGFFHA